MNRREVAQVLNVLHGAYRTEVDEAMALVWANVLETVELTDGLEAASQWVLNEPRFPTPAELLAAVRKARTARLQDAAQMRAAIGAWRCDGTGWMTPPGSDDRQGLEPCPTCNPWMRQHWEAGSLHGRLPRPPEDYVQPRPCTPHHSIEGDQVPVRMPAYVQGALARFGRRTGGTR
jgi:hypothetical protein